MKNLWLLVLQTFVLAISLSTPSAQADTGPWPGWRGDGSGVADPEQEVPIQWSRQENLHWATRVPGVGHSSPILWQDRVFVTTALDRVEDPSIQRAVNPLRMLLALWGLGWCLGGRGVCASRPRINSYYRRIVLLVLFWALLYSLLQSLGSVIEDLRQSAGRNLLLWSGASGLAGILVATVRDAVESGLSVRDPIPGSGLRRWLTTVLAVGPTSAFYGAILVFSIDLLDREVPPAASQDWVLSTLICLVGLLISSLGKDSPWARKPYLAMWASPALAFLFFGPPRDPLGWFVPGHLLGKLTLVVWILTLAALVTRGLGWSRILQAIAGRPIRHHALRATPVLLLTSVQALALWGSHFPNAVLYQVVCLDLETGKVLWRTNCAREDGAPTHAHNSLATPTPTTDGTLIFADFGKAGLFGLTMTGDIAWSFPGTEDEILHGVASSPALQGEVLVISRDSEHSFTRAHDLGSGRVLWETPRNQARAPTALYDAYASPIIATISGTPVVIHFGVFGVVGLHPETGERLWTVPLEGGQVVATPSFHQGTLILTTGRRKTPTLRALEITSHDGRLQSRTLWEATRMIPTTSSPVVHDGKIYGVTESGIATCRSLETGVMDWRVRLPPSTYYSSPIYVGGNVLFSNLDGQTVVVGAASRPGEILARNSLDDPISASLAIASNSIVIRGRDWLYRVGEPQAAESSDLR